MFKVFRSYARFLLVAVIAIRELFNTTTGKGLILNAVVDWTRANPTHPATVQLSTFNWSDELDLPDNEIDEITDNLLVGFTSPATSGDYDLITKVVDFLGLPWTTNRISTSTLQSLRSAILRPSEIAAFTKAYTEALHCATCERKLSQDEIISFRAGKNLDPVIYCTACSSPRLGRCPNCGEVAHISAGGMAVLQSSKLVSCDCVNAGSKAAQSAKRLFIHKASSLRGASAGAQAPSKFPPGYLQSIQSIGIVPDPFGDNS